MSRSTSRPSLGQPLQGFSGRPYRPIGTNWNLLAMGLVLLALAAMVLTGAPAGARLYFLVAPILLAYPVIDYLLTLSILISRNRPFGDCDVLVLRPFRDESAERVVDRIVSAALWQFGRVRCIGDNDVRMPGRRRHPLARSTSYSANATYHFLPDGQWFRLMREEYLPRANLIVVDLSFYRASIRGELMEIHQSDAPPQVIFIREAAGRKGLQPERYANEILSPAFVSESSRTFVYDVASHASVRGLWSFLVTRACDACGVEPSSVCQVPPGTMLGQLMPELLDARARDDARFGIEDGVLQLREAMTHEQFEALRTRLSLKARWHSIPRRRVSNLRRVVREWPPSQVIDFAERFFHSQEEVVALEMKKLLYINGTARFEHLWAALDVEPQETEAARSVRVRLIVVLAILTSDAHTDAISKVVAIRNPTVAALVRSQYVLTHEDVASSANGWRKVNGQSNVTQRGTA